MSVYEKTPFKHIKQNCFNLHIPYQSILDVNIIAATCKITDNLFQRRILQ